MTATILTDANGARLSLVSQNSGSLGDFSITKGPGGPGGLAFTHLVTGTNASVTVDGATLSSATNTVTGAIPGVTLDFQSQQVSGASPVDISISPDTSTITSAVSSFVSAYNTLIGDLNTQFTYNTSTGSEGVLSSDSSARALQNAFLGAANLSIGSGALTTLQSLGISTQQNGTLSLNSATLAQNLSSNYQGVVNFFQGNSGSGTGSGQGFAASLLNILTTYTDPSQGAFTVDLQSISSENQDLTNQIDTFQRYLATQQTVLTAEYNTANIALQQLPQQIKETQAILGENTSGSNG